MTDKNEKLFSAIGKLKDNYVEEAYSQHAENEKRSHSVKSIVIIAFAAVLSLSLMVTVAANSDRLLEAIFERRQELVDDKIGHIYESSTVGNITLTMDSIVVENDGYNERFAGIWTVSFHNDGGLFQDGLKYSGYKIEALFGENKPSYGEAGEKAADGRIWYDIGSYSYPETMGQKDYDIFYADLYNINYGIDNPSDTITLTGFWHNGYYSDCRLTFYGLTSYDGSINYADELSVEFTVSHDNAKLLTQLNYEPDITFEIEGVTFEITDIQMDADGMNVHISNPALDRVNIGGVDCYAINYFTKLANSDEYIAKDKEVSELDAAKSKQNEGESFEEAMNRFTEWMMSDERAKLEGDVYALCVPTENQYILNECYELAVEINPESGAEIVSMSTDCSGGSGEMIFAGMDVKFSSPIYVDDIIRVYARKIGDHSKEVTIWIPAEDKALAEMKK